MRTLLKRIRWLTAAERVARILRVCMLLRALTMVLLAAAKLWKRKGR